MTGILLPGGGTLYGESFDSPGLCGTPGDGLPLPGGGNLYGLTPCGEDPLPDLLAEFSWLADAQFDKSFQLTDRISGAVATHPTPQAENIGPSAFSGTALIGQMNLTGGTTSGEWFTDLDFSWEAGLLEHVVLATGEQHPIQILYIPASDPTIAWLEVNFLANADGTVGIFLDAGGDGVAARFNWASDVSVGNWDEHGVDIYPGRITCVGLTGAVTLFTDGSEVDTGTAGLPHLFVEPPDGTEVWAGGSTDAARPIVSFTLLDGIDGDPIIAFDATDTTGWEEETGLPTTAPLRPAYVGLPALPFSLASSSAQNLPATLDRTLVTSMRAIATNSSWVGRNVNGIFGGQAGWAFAKFDGFAVPWSFVISSGSMQPIVTTFGTLDGDDHVLTVTVDRDTDILTTYVDGGAKDTSDISTLGAVSPSATTQIGIGYSWIYAVGGVDRLLTHPEIVDLNRLLL